MVSFNINVTSYKSLPLNDRASSNNVHSVCNGIIDTVWLFHECNTGWLVEKSHGINQRMPI